MENVTFYSNFSSFLSARWMKTNPTNMENSENASQNDRDMTTQQLQQQQYSSGRTENAEESVRKLMKPVPVKRLGKMNPALLKNVKDAMKSAVAKSKGEICDDFFLIGFLSLVYAL